MAYQGIIWESNGYIGTLDAKGEKVRLKTCLILFKEFPL